MTNLRKVFNAGRVRRWHNCPGMSQFDDFNDGHQGRCARLLLAIHPSPSVILLAAALTHDDGELLAGDMCRNTKNRSPELREMVRQVEREGFCDVWDVESTWEDELDDDEKRWLKFVDRLDAYMWMKHKKPEMLTQTDWRKEHDWLMSESATLGVFEEVRYL